LSVRHGEPISGLRMIGRHHLGEFELGIDPADGFDGLVDGRRHDDDPRPTLSTRHADGLAADFSATHWQRRGYSRTRLEPTELRKIAMALY
jgi:hypothetical protein